jgi:hypothetical protein
MLSGLIWIATLSVIPVSWGQQAPFYDTVQFEHAPSVNHKIGPLFCGNISKDVIRDNPRDALIGDPLTNKIYFHYCCRIVYPSYATPSAPFLMPFVCVCVKNLGMVVTWLRTSECFSKSSPLFLHVGATLSVGIVDFEDPFYLNRNENGEINIAYPGLFVEVMDEIAFRAGLSWRNNYGIILMPR